MLRPTSHVEVYLYMAPVDMRKSINGLAALVENELEAKRLVKEATDLSNYGTDLSFMVCRADNAGATITVSQQAAQTG